MSAASDDGTRGACMRSFQLAAIAVNATLSELAISLNGLMIYDLRVVKTSSFFFFMFGVTDFNESESISKISGTKAVNSTIVFEAD